MSENCIEEHSNWVKTEYNYCPSCGSSLARPKPKKTLAGFISEVMSNPTLTSAEEIASKAREYILDAPENEQMIVEILKANLPKGWSSYELVAKAILDYLKKESH